MSVAPVSGGNFTTVGQAAAAGSYTKVPLSQSNTPSNSGSWLGDTFQVLTSAVAPVTSGAIGIYNGAVDGIDNVPAGASSPINHLGSDMETAYANALSAAGQVASTIQSGAEAVAAPVGGVVTGVINTGEGAVTILSWTPAIIILGIVGLLFLFPESGKRAISAAKMGALA